MFIQGSIFYCYVSLQEYKFLNPEYLGFFLQGLVGGLNPIETYVSNRNISPKDPGENRKSLKPPPIVIFFSYTLEKQTTF